MTPGALKAKVSSILQRVQPSDLASPEAREKFLAHLPPELFGTIGGNTTCFEVELGDDQVLLVDAGTGIREAGRFHESTNPRPKHYHIFLTHFHWDHLQGIPFFAGLAQARNRVTFYSPVSGFEELVRQQMREPYFPIPMAALPAQVRFVELQKPLAIAGTTVEWKRVNHPGVAYSYRFSQAGKVLVFSTDTELRDQDYDRDRENIAFFGGAHALVIDAQYTEAELVDRVHWGHSSVKQAVDFALEFETGMVYLFHHEPDHDDARIEEMARTAQWYADTRVPGRLRVILAREGRSEVLG